MSTVQINGKLNMIFWRFHKKSLVGSFFTVITEEANL